MSDRVADLFTALRGFKVRPQTLDKYLAANGSSKGTDDGRNPPEYEVDDNGAASDEMSSVLRSRAAAITSDGDSSGILVVVPHVHCHERSPWVYVAYSYAFIYSQRHITANVPSEQVPRGFEELRREILGYGSTPDPGEEGMMGLYIVFTYDRPCPVPAELKQRGEPPFQCGICERTYDSWGGKQNHRYIVHDLKEATDDLPENC